MVCDLLLLYQARILVRFADGLNILVSAQLGPSNGIADEFLIVLKHLKDVLVLLLDEVELMTARARAHHFAVGILTTW